MYIINRQTEKQIDISHGVIVIDNSKDYIHVFQGNSKSNILN